MAHRSEDVKSLMVKYKSKFSPVSYYHPQANPVERVHRILKTMLPAYVSESHELWDSYLVKVAYVIWYAKHDVTKLTTNFVIFESEIHLSAVKCQQGCHVHSGPVARQEALDKLFEVLNRLMIKVKSDIICALEMNLLKYIKYIGKEIIVWCFRILYY